MKRLLGGQALAEISGLGPEMAGDFGGWTAAFAEVSERAYMAAEKLDGVYSCINVPIGRRYLRGPEGVVGIMFGVATDGLVLPCSELYLRIS